MASSNAREKLIPPPPEENNQNIEMEGQQAPVDNAEKIEDIMLDETFWLKVREKVDTSEISWNRAMDEVRAEHFITKYGNKALFVIIHKWPKSEEYQEKSQFNQSFEYLISRMAEIILEKNTTIDYSDRIEGEDKLPQRPTLLHLAAVQNFLHVSQCLVDRYPGLLYVGTADEQDDLPVELALREKNDITAAYLISRMRNKRVENLFVCSANNEIPSKHYFGDIISWGMKKTVVAVLDKLINPRWPYLPENPEEDKDGEIQRALDCIPYDPMRYDFHYHILEADENGRQPKIKIVKEEETTSVIASKSERGQKLKKYKIVENSRFNCKSVSCLQKIADSKNKEAVEHPVVRMLVKKKWKEFAYPLFCIKAALYLVFLLVLSFSLTYGSTREDPTQYINRADKLRAFCEISSIILLMFQLFDEIGEVARERKMYFKFWQNYVDVLGITLTLPVIPLRFAEAKSQWSIAALGYGCNFVRLLKFSAVSRTMGLYTTTFMAIIYKDITRFLMFFSVIFLGFCGAMFLVLKGEDTLDTRYRNFTVLMLAGFRAFVEQQPLEEKYDEFGWLTILILLFYMGVVIVILLNVLIAQLSYRYSEAKKTAKLQYAANTMRIVTRLESNRFPRWNFRVKFYERDGWVNDEDLAEEMLEYNEDRPPWETVEERVPIVREVMRRFVRKGKEKDPLESIDEKVTQLTSAIEKSSSRFSILY